MISSRNIISISTCLAFFFLSLDAYCQIRPPSGVTVSFSESSIDITWDSVPGAAGYNIYTGGAAGMPKAKKTRVNSRTITSGTHFTFLWHFEKGVKVRKVKGYKHFISIAAVFSINGRMQESGLSEEFDNCYFDGFAKVASAAAIKSILEASQATPFLPVKHYDNSREKFVAFMTGPGAKLLALIKKHIDPQEVGGCTPISTILVKILKECGLEAYRIDGAFIKEFHSFVLIPVGDVEYVLDFAADQFIPDVSPVMVPRDLCHLSDRGKLSRKGTPVYTAAKIFGPESVFLSDDASASVYRQIYDELKSSLQ